MTYILITLALGLSMALLMPDMWPLAVFMVVLSSIYWPCYLGL